MSLLTPEQEQDQLQRLRGGFTPLGAPDEAAGGMVPVGASGDSAAAAQRPVIAKPNLGPRAINVPPVQDELSRSMMPTPMQRDQENLNHENSLTPKIWRRGDAGGIKNPILRAMARVGDVAGTALFPSITGQIPGTELHHKLAVQGAENRVNQDIVGQEHQAQTALSQAHAQALLNPQVKTAFEAWQAQNPGVPVEKFFEMEQNEKPDKNPSEFGEWRKQNPQAPLSQWFDLKNSAKPDTSTEADNRYRGIEQKLMQKQDVSPEDQAWAKAYEKGKTLGPVTSAALAAPGKNDARVDRSYQYNSTQLEKVRQPIEAKMDKLSTAMTNIDLKSPQADALLAPEILSVMAGGAGSGLRMNEAEISRILGGATVWENLKRSVNKWSTDPNHPSIPPEQRAQMVKILSAALDKAAQKMKIIEDAEGQLVDSEDPGEHRRIVTAARRQLDAVDGGTAQGGAEAGETVEYVRDASGKLVPKK